MHIETNLIYENLCYTFLLCLFTRSFFDFHCFLSFAFDYNVMLWNMFYTNFKIMIVFLEDFYLWPISTGA
jgi:hypothetical protein